MRDMIIKGVDGSAGNSGFVLLFYNKNFVKSTNAVTFSSLFLGVFNHTNPSPCYPNLLPLHTVL
jgi:hypothetical protein